MSNSTTRERALTLLGQGIPPQVTANTIGVDISMISQLLSEEQFATEVIERKFLSLSKNNERDGNIDSLEDRMIKKLSDCLPFMTKPMEILKAFTVLNSAKRRGQNAPDSLTQKTTVVQLNIPAILIERFTANIHNQVVQVGEKSLLTIPSRQMTQQLESRNATTLATILQTKVADTIPVGSTEATA